MLANVMGDLLKNMYFCYSYSTEQLFAMEELIIVPILGHSSVLTLTLVANFIGPLFDNFKDIALYKLVHLRALKPSLFENVCAHYSYLTKEIASNVYSMFSLICI